MPVELTVECPKCHCEFELTDSLAAPLLAANREEFDRRLAAQRKAIAEEEARKAKALLGDELGSRTRKVAELEELLEDRQEKLAEAQKEQAEVLRKARALEDKERELDLTIERRVSDGVASTREQARREVGDELKLKLSERDHTIDAMKKYIEELKQRADQGSQQLQGEVLELELEALLGSKFPQDTITPVPKGEFGGDVLHRICGPAGRDCGTILWESKRTKHWSDGWLVKLRGDQREARAEVAVLVSAVLPRGVETFELVDSIWVVHPRIALPLATILRSSLVELSTQRIAGQGLQTKTELMYEYLTGARFRQRVMAIVEGFTTLQEDLLREQNAIKRLWAKRQAQIDVGMGATIGMYGDLQGIAGKTLPEIEGLALPEPEFEALR
jgi:hypothetical protein